MYRLLKHTLRKFLILPCVALFILVFISEISMAKEPYLFDKRTIPLLDLAMFQINLGWTDLKGPNETLDIFDPVKTDVHYINASGMHIGINFIDIKPIPSSPTWALGGRIGAQIFSGLKDTITTEVVSTETA